jgi:DNA-nicking Smr family endonuclease
MDTEDERQAFREAMRGVRRLRAQEPAVQAARPKRRALAAFARADRRQVLAESLAEPASPQAPVIESGEEIQFRGARVSEQVFRNLRRGIYRVDAELDLHGLSAAQARVELQAFIAAALVAGLRVVRVIHGKGLRSGNRGPVLRRMVNTTLQRLSVVLAFASAREVDGGTGACLVLLQRPAGFRVGRTGQQPAPRAPRHGR